MGRKGTFEERARQEVDRIKTERAAEEERKQSRMSELAEEARQRKAAEAAEERRRQDERNAKLRRSQQERVQGEKEGARRAMFNTWVANGGSPAEFEAAWPNLRREMLTQRTLE
jgi:hypothetical protein